MKQSKEIQGVQELSSILEMALAQIRNTKYYSEDVCKKLGITRSTLWKWGKSGYLKPDGKIGKRPFYFQSTLDKIGLGA